MEDHRRAPRRRALKGAKIVFNGAASVIDCVIRDVSETGARLKAVAVVGIPDTFTLVSHDGARYECEVAWRKTDQLVVRFV